VTGTADQLVAGLERLGSETYMLELIALNGNVPGDVRKQVADIAASLSAQIDALRTLARTAT
jgi:hypothetical protein